MCQAFALGFGYPVLVFACPLTVFAGPHLEKTRGTRINASTISSVTCGTGVPSLKTRLRKPVLREHHEHFNNVLDALMKDTPRTFNELARGLRHGPTLIDDRLRKLWSWDIHGHLRDLRLATTGVRTRVAVNFFSASGSCALLDSRLRKHPDGLDVPTVRGPCVHPSWSVTDTRSEALQACSVHVCAEHYT